MLWASTYLRAKTAGIEHSIMNTLGGGIPYAAGIEYAIQSKRPTESTIMVSDGHGGKVPRIVRAHEMHPDDYAEAQGSLVDRVKGRLSGLASAAAYGVGGGLLGAGIGEAVGDPALTVLGGGAGLIGGAIAGNAIGGWRAGYEGAAERMHRLQERLNIHKATAIKPMY